MKELEEKHWTDDDELIERFVLNRLNPEERNELEDHLRICEVCKRAVRAEGVLVAGIRRGGREQFKAGLSRKVANLPLGGRRPEKQTPWVQILSAAAVVLIIISVGIYNRWFEFQNPQENGNMVFAPQPSTVNNDKEVEQPSIVEKRVEQQLPSSPPSGTHEKTQEANRREERPRVAIIRSKESTHEPLAETLSKTGNVASGAGAIAANQPQIVQADQVAMEAVTIAPSEFESIWLEGTILPNEKDDFRDKAKTEERQATSKAMYKSDSTTKKQSVYRTQAGAMQTQHVSSTLYSLNQQNSLSLPPTQQRLQQLSNAKVLTKVERIGSKTQMTLYLDSLLDENELANATIETLRNDSLILNLQNQRIGYKLPAGWNTQLQTKPAK